MTEEAQAALNETEGAPTSDETLNSGESSAPKVSSDDLISTVEFETANPEQEEKPAEKPDVETPEGEDGKDHGPVPYERFQEKAHQFKELSEKFDEQTKRLQELETQINTRPEPKKEEPKTREDLPFIDMSAKSDDDLVEWHDKEPLNFYRNLATQIIHEAKQDMLEILDSRDKTSAFNSKIKEFSEKHDGFDSMYKSGRLKDFTDNNPGHDVFSAFYELTKDSRDASVKDQIEKAVKEAEERIKKQYEDNIKAKRKLRTIDPGPAAHTSTEKELENTKSGGGLTNVLAQRLVRRRAKAG